VLTEDFESEEHLYYTCGSNVSL